MRSGAAQANPPFTSCATRRRVDLEYERALAALLESVAASIAKRVHEELLNEVWMVHGRAHVDKRDLPAEQGKGVNAKETRECNYRPEEGLPRD